MSISMREVCNFQGTPGAIGSFRHLLATLPFGVTIGLREIHRRLMGPEILREYFPDGLLDTLEAVKAGLQSVIRFSIPTQIEDIPGRPRPLPGNDQARSTNIARNGLFHFLQHQAFEEVRHTLGIAYNHFAKREFPVVLETLDTLEHSIRNVHVSPITKQTISSAFTRTNIPYTDIFVVPQPSPDPRKEIPLNTTLPRYAGPEWNAYQIAQLLDFHEFLSRGPEYDYRMGLLRAECHLGGGELEQAIDSYQTLLQKTLSRDPGRHRLRREFVTIRLGIAHLTKGDQLFRKQRALNAQDRENIIGIYDEAVRLVQGRDVSPDHPRRQEVETHASQQKAKLQRPLNYLGLWDAFVPVQRYSKLEEAAAQQIQDAITSAETFKSFLHLAEQEIEQQMDVRFQRNQEELSLGILDLRQENATLSVDKIEEQLSAINDQQGFLVAETVFGGLRAIVGGIGVGRKPGHPALGWASGVLGVGGTLVNFFAQDNELAHQRRMAEIEKEIAQNNVAIANVEREMSQRRMEFYGQKLAFLEHKRLNADVLYTLAELNEKRAERQLEGAIFLAYLFERALAFFLGEPNIDHIQFDYLDRPGGIFDAATALQEDFRRVQQEFNKVEEEKFDFFEEIISLRESYPIQFSRFLQTGEMDFVYSLYQLSRRRPATHQCRLHEVGVEVVGLLPPTGFSGTLTHLGRFLVRDKTATLRDPDATRLVPTDDQLAQALEEQRRQGLPVAAVGGVLYYDLEPDSKELSLHTQFVSQVRPDRPTLNLFEGRGPTGLWHLEIREHGQLAIADILLHFAIVSRESDPSELEPKVETLIRSYEAELAEGDLLDRISAFSLRQHFPDSFFALQTGPADLVLGEENFPSGLTNLQVKMVIAQALDQEGKGAPGVALEISRQEFGFNQVHVTQTDGFSEDLDAPPPSLPRDQRFPVVGAWQIRLSNSAQFAHLGDLRLFFMYAFEEL